jgi:8-oxo-dGTP pyrophosphatase MutT (NUDIX family)
MPWKVLEKTDLFQSGLFQLRSEKLELPDGRVMPRYFVMSFPDWVNVLPLTTDQQVILVKQYRHASGRIHLEVPGGSLDPHRKESVEEGAQRELLEETGYGCERLELIASHYPNPALQTNRMHTFIAWNCFLKQEQKLDEFEDLELYFCSLEKLEEHLREGDIDHSIMIASIAQTLSHLKESENQKSL